MSVMLSSFRSLTVALAMIAVAAFVVQRSALAAKAPMVGLVKQVKNNAFGTPPGAERERKFLRFPVVVDELLETDTRASMLVEFLDASTLTLGPSSHLRVDTMVYNPKTRNGTSVIYLTVGLFRYVSGKIAEGDVRIVTPSAILGIRGSDVMINVSPDGATTISVFSGVFRVSNLAGTAFAMVVAAQTVSVSAAGAVGAVVNGPAAPPIGLSIQVKESDPDFGLDKVGDDEGYGGDARGGRRTGFGISRPVIIRPQIYRSSN